ncbi:MAG: PAS domain S-box protein, partial [Gammaproteobacteria bacterium]|nr:PAS domain S-box protein [Gammaproteobacteria bacterium]
MVDQTSTLTGLQRSLNGSRTGGGIDVVYTKIAVDFQNVVFDALDETVSHGIQGLLEGTGAGAVVMALLDAKSDVFEFAHVARSEFSAANPSQIEGDRLSQWPWLHANLRHLSLLEIRDTLRPPAGAEIDCKRLANFNIASMLMIGFHVRGRPAGFLAFCFGEPHNNMDVDHQLLLKLIGSSFSSGLERIWAAREIEDAAERRELVTLTANDGLWDYDALEDQTEFSPQWKRMMGYTDNTLAEMPPDWRRLIHQDDLARVQTILRSHLAGETPLFESMHRMQRLDGDWRWMKCRAKAMFDDNGRLRRIVGVETDITEQKVYEEALFREKESAQITLQSIGDGVITTDEAGAIEYLNPVAQELTGWKIDDAIGRNLDEVFRGFHEETCEPLENPLSQSMDRNRSIKSVRPTLLIRRDGNEIYVESTASPIRDDRANVTGGVLVFHDVSEARELNRRLSYHASHDLLTGLVNRREFESRMDRALKSARAGEASYALCYLDLDRFKIVNDTCGHGAGDSLLGQIGALLKSKIRWRDSLARLGGDEFGVLLESCTMDEAVQAAEELVQAIQDFKFTWEDRNFSLTVSVGVVP